LNIDNSQRKMIEKLARQKLFLFYLQSYLFW